ncbi:MAG: response regulator transcription factor [Acidobacteriota bacterium]
MNDPIRLLLADDHQLFRQSLAAVFASEPGFEVVGEAATGERALTLVADLRPHVVLLDVAFAEVDGITVAQRIHAQFRNVRVLIVSMHTERATVERALLAGADGYALKEDSIDDLLYGVRSVHRGGRFLSPTLVRAHGNLTLTPRRGESQRREPTARQREILVLVAQGLTNKQVAERLGLRPKTIENHRMNIARQYDLHGAVDYVRYAIRRGWIKA